MSDADELAAIARRYARRAPTDRYSLLRPDVWQNVQERERVMLTLFASHGLHDPQARRCIEVGCGSGANLLELLRIGFRPEHLAGVELLAARHAEARACLPSDVAVHLGDACAFDAGREQDLVLAFTVFSSILDETFQKQLAAAMWRWLKPGGAVLWYDFTVDNPLNPDVRGVPLRRLRDLFPDAAIDARRVTLAPPIARAVCRIHPALYTLCNTVPFLRTHVMAWIGKP